MKRWVIGDIHGEADKLIALLKAIDFDYENDQLIQLGDVVDRGAKSFETVEELLKIKNGIYLRGNHDACWRDSVLTGKANLLYGQGGRETMLSYTRGCKCDGDPTKISETHREFFINMQKNYYIDKDNNLFVHAGINRHISIEEQEELVLIWDRDFFESALSHASSINDYPFKIKGDFNRVFIGHTPTVHWSRNEVTTDSGIITNTGEPITEPIKAMNVINLDTGCGKGDFPLTAMNIDTEEFVQVK